MKEEERIEAGHKVKSEISNDKGNWSKEALAFGRDVETVFQKVMTQHKGKLSVNSMQLIAHNAIFHKCALALMMSAKFE